MNKEELLKAIMELLKVIVNNPISAMNGINVDDLMNAIDRLNKVPTYDELLKENKKQKEAIDKAIKYIDNLRDESAERQEFYNCFPDDLYIPNIKELLDILKEVSE